LFIRALLAALALSFGDASVALAAGIQQPLNIGFVLYSKGNAPGTLNASWTYRNIYSGKGLATGGPKEGFAGHYYVRYYDEQRKFPDEDDLVIEKAGVFYNASWLTNGKLSAGGVGMEVENGLAIGWRRVADLLRWPFEGRRIQPSRPSIGPAARGRRHFVDNVATSSYTTSL
jgi:hypothetical protein